MKKSFSALRSPMITLLTSLVLAPGTAEADDVVVIVHPSVAVNTLSADELMHIFMTKTKTFPNQQPVEPVIPREEQESRQRFERVIFQRNPIQVRAYWTRLLFTGRGALPQVLDSDVDIKKKVAAQPQMIGYIDKTALDDSVKVVFTVQESR